MKFYSSCFAGHGLVTGFQRSGTSAEGECLSPCNVGVASWGARIRQYSIIHVREGWHTSASPQGLSRCLCQAMLDAVRRQSVWREPPDQARSMRRLVDHVVDDVRLVHVLQLFCPAGWRRRALDMDLE